MRPMQAFDAGGRARAMATIVEAMSRAKDAGLAPGDLGAALRLVDWSAEGRMLTLATLPARRIKVSGIRLNKDNRPALVDRIATTIILSRPTTFSLDSELLTRLPSPLCHPTPNRQHHNPH